LTDESGGSEARRGPVIHAGTEDDLPQLTEIYNHYVLNSAVSFDIEPRSAAEQREWFSHYRSDGPHRLLVAGQDTRILGFATSSRFRERAAYDTSVETSVYCHPEAVGRGIGSALYRRLFEELAGEDVHRAYGGIVLPNEASIALHARLGFTEIGVYREVGRKFGRYWDVLWMEKPVETSGV
jgi:phosphinothricin acetyltransferase